MRELYGLAVTMEHLPGERDCNFRARAADGRSFVLKIIDGAADPLATECQVAVLQHLAEQDRELPVPRVIPTQQGTDLGVSLQEGITYATCLVGYIPGQILAQIMPTHVLLGNMGEMLARLDQALQGFFHPALAQRIAWDVRRLPELIAFIDSIPTTLVRNQVEAVCDRLQQLLPKLRGLRSQAIHGDCHGGNLLVNQPAQAICGVLDFGDMIHAPLIFEPAVAMSELLSEGLAEPADLTWVLDGYARVHSLTEADLDVLFELITARHAVTLLLHAWRSHHDLPGASVLERGAERAAASLGSLLSIGRDAMLAPWRDAARLCTAAVSAGEVVPAVIAPLDVARRRRVLGSGAELFYERPLHFVRGEGVWLFDPRGRRYLDAYNNVPHVGHCHPAVVRAIQEQCARLSTHTRYFHEKILEYAEALTALCPTNLNACIFVNSGSEANDVAWRLARFATGHDGAVVMAHAYHGITEAAAALSPGTGPPADPRVVALAPPPDALVLADTLPPAARGAAAQDADRVLAALESQGSAPAAFFIDSALTSSGIFDPPPAWLDLVAAKVRAAGGLIIADEVQYGFGRSGSNFWGFGRRGLACPDVVTLGKPAGNGYPIGVIIADRTLIESFQAKFGFFSTFGGNAVAAAAGLAVLDVLSREGLVANAWATGEYLRRSLTRLSVRHACFGRVRGAGLLLGLEVLGTDVRAAHARAHAIVNALALSGVLIGIEGPRANILKLRPPMPFGPGHVDLLTEALDAVAERLE